MKVVGSFGVASPSATSFTKPVSSAETTGATQTQTVAPTMAGQWLYGNDGVNDTLVGTAGDDTFVLSTGNDALTGGDGVDRLIGASDLTGVGGSGDDTDIVDAGERVSDWRPGASGGFDHVRTTASHSLFANNAIERLSVVDPASTTAINLNGDEFAQAILGNAGPNVITGGAGADTLTGYGGRDIFRFASALGPGEIERIVDFSVADDRIQLDDAVFARLPVGALAGAAFAFGSVATQAAQRIFYDSANGALCFDADGSGSTYSAARFATLPPVIANLSASNFSVY